MFGRYGHTKAKLIEWRSRRRSPRPRGPSVRRGRDARDVSRGARPWDRDHDDNRALFFVPEGRGQIINDEKDVSEYPQPEDDSRAFRRGRLGPRDDGAEVGTLSGAEGPLTGSALRRVDIEADVHERGAAAEGSRAQQHCEPLGRYPHRGFAGTHLSRRARTAS